MFGNFEEGLGVVLVVPNVPISVAILVMGKRSGKKTKVPFSSKEQDSVVTPEWHHNSGRLVEGDHLAVFETTRIPDANLSVAHFAEASGCNGTLVAHPNDTHTLNAAVTFANTDGITACTGIKQANFPVSASRDQRIANGVKCKALNCISMNAESGLW